MTRIGSLDAYENPPQSIKDVYRFYHKISSDALEADLEILDFRRGRSREQQKTIMEAGLITRSEIDAACLYFGKAKALKGSQLDLDVQVYEVEDMPGLRLIPSLVPKSCQIDLLSTLLHENLAEPRHKTNVHFHHQLPYRAAVLENENIFGPKGDDHAVSFFNLSPDSREQFLPIDSHVHKPFTNLEFLSRKLRWLTLGGQFEWTGKRYPLEEEPPFPEDVGGFINHIFPHLKPEAAIVNIYRPGDFLSVHRDVSEESDNCLVSISLGCEGLFIVGAETEHGKEPKCLVVRLHSGDAVYMSGPARFAWHGVPRIFPGTCPSWLCDWPARMFGQGNGRDENDRFESWRGWMSNKRINLSIRQIRD